MDVTESPSSSSSSTKRSPDAKPFSASDENDPSLHLRRLGFSNMKKPSPKKNLPTDGASKVTPPRNKVLTERNGSRRPIGNIPVSYSEPVKASPSTSGSKISPSLSADKIGKESVLPYEPFTNYLSPRPRFLRYKPDRQREMALRLEKEAGKGKEGSSSGGSSDETADVNGEGADSVSSSDILKLQGEEDHEHSDDEEEEEEEEEEEQRSSICRELLKTLLLLLVLVFPASSYLSDMNSAPSISLEVGISEDGYPGIKNFTYEAALYERALGLGCGLNLMNQACELENDVDFLVKNVDGIDELEEQEEVIEFKLGAIKNTIDDGNEEAMVDVGEEVELNLEGSHHIDQEIAKPDEVSDQLTEGFELQQSENAENLDSEIPNALDVEARPPLEPETQTLLRSEVEEEWGRTDEENEVNLPIAKPEAELSNEVLMFRIGIESSSYAIIGLLTAALAISAAFLFSLFLKGKRNPANPVCSSPLKKQPCPEPVAEEKHNPQFQMKEQNCTDPVVPNSIADLSPPVPALQEASTQSNQSQAPKIELLGEFVVGELSSSYRSREMKSKMISKVEESTNSVSTDKSGIKVDVTQPALSEFSSMNCPSHGSFTADRHIEKPQEDGTGESRTAVVTPARRSSRIQNTPVRRSSRIRNQAIQSP